MLHLICTATLGMLGTLGKTPLGTLGKTAVVLHENLNHV